MQTIQSISTKELRDNLAEVLEQVAIGNRTFMVEKFGKKKALISPIETRARNKPIKIDFSKLPAYGLWKSREEMRDIAEWVSGIRRKNSRSFSI